MSIRPPCPSRTCATLGPASSDRGIGIFAVVAALTIDISQYTNFLYLIGAVFIPLSGALIAAWLRTRGVGWNTSPDAPVRPWMLVAWAAGFVAYQLVNPGAIPGWSDAWMNAGTWLHTVDHPWLSASITAFVVAVRDCPAVRRDYQPESALVTGSAGHPTPA